MQNPCNILRSMLYVPAYKKNMIDSALRCDADALIIDLEDAVPSLYKSDARQHIAEYLAAGAFKNKNVFVRLNPMDSKMLMEDLKFSLHRDVTGYLLTKIYTYDDILYYDKFFSQMENDYNLPDKYFSFIPLIETTSAVMDVYNIARATKRNVALCFGGEDFLDNLAGIHGTPSRSFDYPRAAIALAARAAGVLPIDTPYLALDDQEGFEREERVSFEMGFAGCQLIHPKQIALANKCFTPSAEEIAHSLAIVQAIRDSEQKGSGVAMLDGMMIGPPMRKRADRVIKFMKALEDSQ